MTPGWIRRRQSRITPALIPEDVDSASFEQRRPGLAPVYRERDRDGRAHVADLVKCARNSNLNCRSANTRKLLRSKAALENHGPVQPPISYRWRQAPSLCISLRHRE